MKLISLSLTGLSGAWLLAGVTYAPNQVAAASLDFPAIEQRIQQLQPTSDVKRFDDIGWARDIRAGLRLAKASGRPLFLFTHDGRMNLGRC